MCRRLGRHTSEKKSGREAKNLAVGTTEIEVEKG